MASWCAVTVIVLRIIVLLLQQHLCFESKNYVYHNFNPTTDGFSKSLADISPYLSASWVSTKDVVLRKASYPSCYRYGFSFSMVKSLHFLLLSLLLSGDVQVNPGPVPISKGLKLCHWNTQHLTDSKFEEIKSMLLKDFKDLDILFLTETFCSSKIPDSFYNIPGYELFRKDRLGKKGGGILAFVNNSVIVERRSDLEAGEIESLWLEVCPHKSKRSLFIGGIYRPPSYKIEDDKKLGKNIENVHLKNKEIILMGDLNVDFSNSSKFKKHSLMKTLCDLHMVQLVNVITRPLSSTCLDHIWTTHPERMNNVCTITSGLSDHLPILGTRTYKRAKPKVNEHTIITYRDFKKLDKEKLNASLKEAPWDSAFVFEDSNDVIDAWYKIFEDVVNAHLPIKHKKVKRKVQPKWFTCQISQEITKRNTLLAKAKQNQSVSDWSNYKQSRNNVSKLIRKSKESYFNKKMSENKHDPKKLWKLIKGLTNGSDSSCDSIKRLKSEDGFLTDKKDIADKLNSFFVNQPKDLLDAQNIGEDVTPSSNHEIIQSKNGLKIPYITNKRVAEIILSIPAHKATGDDGISAKLLRITASAITSPLCRLINHCLDTATFPSMWKVAKVTPIFKKQGSKDDKSNYRPISILPVLSKVFEKHICESLYIHLKNNNMLHKLQSGFRKSHSTDTALIHLIDQLLFSLDSNNVIGLVFIDYRKAFDLINHDILLSKLRGYDIGEREVQLFKNYLSGRSQYVNIDGTHSHTKPIHYGVPQGSVLGPLLFLIFVNDLPAAVQHSVVNTYADDTALSYSCDVNIAPDTLCTNLQRDMDRIVKWSDDNKMILNESKTKCMIVTGKRLSKRMDNDKLSIQINEKELDQVQSQKHLGVTIDNKLSFDDHVEELCKKLSQRIAVLKKIRRFLPTEQRMLYYNALIKQVMMYGSTIWTSCSSENLTKVLKLQKRAARVILNADTRDNSVKLFSKLGWLPFYDEAKIIKCLFVYKCLVGDCPQYLNNLITKNSDIHKRKSRYGEWNLVCRRFNRETEGGKSFSVSSTRLWNSLPTNIKDKAKVSLASLRKALNDHFHYMNKDIHHFKAK